MSKLKLLSLFIVVPFFSFGQQWGYGIASVKYLDNHGKSIDKFYVSDLIELSYLGCADPTQLKGENVSDEAYEKCIKAWFFNKLKTNPTSNDVDIDDVTGIIGLFTKDVLPLFLKGTLKLDSTNIANSYSSLDKETAKMHRNDFIGIAKRSHVDPILIH